jgi:hypothetical protein
MNNASNIKINLNSKPKFARKNSISWSDGNAEISNKNKHNLNENMKENVLADLDILYFLIYNGICLKNDQEPKDEMSFEFLYSCLTKLSKSKNNHVN